MNGSQIKQAAIQKAKQVASTASNGNANKKRKKELKPIITTEGAPQDAESASAMATSNPANSAG
jgi:serine/threonine-protein kinase SRPK3